MEDHVFVDTERSDGMVTGREFNDLRASSAEAYSNFVQGFHLTSEPVEVSFRKLVSAFGYGARATHFIHPYPAKLLAHIPYFFLNNPNICPPQSTILDPFCGSGTTLLEAMISGHNAVGIDVNPFAVLLTKAKTTPIAPRWLRAMAEAAIDSRCTNAVARKSPPDIPNPRLWYTPEALVELSRLKHGVFQCSNAKYRRALMVAFSLAARSLSLADPRMPVPVRVRMKNASTNGLRQRFRTVFRAAREADAIGAFRASIEKMASRYDQYRHLLPDPRSVPDTAVYCDNVMDPGLRADQSLSGSVDVVITSPPYCGAQKYVRSTSLSLGWLDLARTPDLAALEHSTVGREHIRHAEQWENFDQFPPQLIQLVRNIQRQNPMRAAIVSKYFTEMRLALAKIVSWLKPEGRMVLVVGDSYVCGQRVPTSDVLRGYLSQLGVRTEVVLRDGIVSRGLLTTRKGADTLIASENIIVLRKEK